MRVAIIDADTIVWTAAYLAQRDNLAPEAMIQELDTFITSILKNTKAEKYIGFLQGADNFRKRMFADYKANRPEPPDWVKLLGPMVRMHLVNQWKFVYTTDGFEADDAVASIAENLDMYEYGDDFPNAGPKFYKAIICAVDKDLKQIPGEHYNYKTGETQVVLEEEATHNASMQLLHGDTSDNIPNIRKGIGPAKAARILEGTNTTSGRVALEEFQKEYGFFNGLVKFSENVLKVVLRRDNKYPFELNDVPEYIKQSQTFNIQ